MRKTLLTLASSAAIALGGLSIAPQPANAVAWWVAPAIVGGVVVGAAGAAAASNSYAGPNAAGHYAYAPDYYVPRQPYDPIASDMYAAAPDCYWARERVRGGWARVRVCD